MARLELAVRPAVVHSTLSLVRRTESRPMTRALPRSLPKTLLLTLAATAALAACQRGAETPEAPKPAAEPAKPAAYTFKDAIDAGDFAGHVKMLASDEFEGRKRFRHQAL